MWQERANYGHFFYRIPNGESAADAYDRISGFNESLWRQFGEDDSASVFVLVTHGLMTRVFLMKWLVPYISEFTAGAALLADHDPGHRYHFSVEYFEDLRNVNHCEFVIMKQNPDNGKYILETKLRTWSELKLECALAENAGAFSPSKIRNEADAYIPVRKKWIGCRSSSNLNDNLSDGEHQTQTTTQTSVEIQGPASEQPDDMRVETGAPVSDDRQQRDGSSSPMTPPGHDENRSYILEGRDFGGSMSGVGSRAGSCSSHEDNDNNNKSLSAVHAAARIQEAIMNDIHHGDHPGDDLGSTMLRAQADRLGDHLEAGSADGTAPARPQNDNNGSGEEKTGPATSTMKKLEAWNKSVEGSVY